MSFEPVKVGSIKTGHYIIDPNTEEVCLVQNIDHSKPGKHGAAKARMVYLTAKNENLSQALISVLIDLLSIKNMLLLLMFLNHQFSLWILKPTNILKHHSPLTKNLQTKLKTTSVKVKLSKLSTGKLWIKSKSMQFV